MLLGRLQPGTRHSPGTSSSSCPGQWLLPAVPFLLFFSLFFCRSLTKSSASSPEFFFSPLVLFLPPATSACEEEPNCMWLHSVVFPVHCNGRGLDSRSHGPIGWFSEPIESLSNQVWGRVLRAEGESFFTCLVQTGLRRRGALNYGSLLLLHYVKPIT